MVFRIEDVFELAKEEDKYNSARFTVTNKLEPNKTIRFKMLDAYFGMFCVDNETESGFMRANTLYENLSCGIKELFYEQFTIEYIG